MRIYGQIKDKFIMKNAREDWKDYRIRLTDLILEQGPESVMLVGAGRCNDIDLHRLCDAVDRICLLDVDEAAKEDVLSVMPDRMRRKVDYRIASLTGIREADMEAFCTRLLAFAKAAGSSRRADDYRRRVMTELDALSRLLVRDAENLHAVLPENAADILVCCGVHSQLFSMLSFFIRSVMYSLQDQLPGIGEMEREVNDRIHLMNDQVIPVINRALYRAASGAVIFGNEYMPERPVEGAYQCIQDVRNSMEPEETNLTWEFNRAEGITYDMLIQICRCERQER